MMTELLDIEKKLSARRLYQRESGRWRIAPRQQTLVQEFRRRLACW
jgi:hypothetical protein